jgi:chromosome segregation ATPase
LYWFEGKKYTLTSERFDAELDREATQIELLQAKLGELSTKYEEEKRELQNLRTELGELRAKEEESAKRIQSLESDVHRLETDYEI